MAKNNDEITKREPSYVKHLPLFYQDVEEIQALALAIDPELIQLQEENENDFLNAFILTAEESSIAVWEKEIGIRADAHTETLDFRRTRLINRYTVKPPFTMRWLENQLVQLLGTGFIRVERDDDVEILTVYADLSSLPLLREFDTTMEAVLPLSMQYFKVLLAYHEIMGGLYAGSTIPWRWHITIEP